MKGVLDDKAYAAWRKKKIKESNGIGSSWRGM